MANGDGGRGARAPRADGPEGGVAMRLLKAVKPDLDPCDEETARRYLGELTEALRQDVRRVVLEASAQSPPEPGWQGVAVGGLLISLATCGARARNERPEP